MKNSQKISLADALDVTEAGNLPTNAITIAGKTGLRILKDAFFNVNMNNEDATIILEPGASFKVNEDGKIYKNDTNSDQTLTFHNGSLVEHLGENSSPYDSI